jgi:hypothetical protein
MTPAVSRAVAISHQAISTYFRGMALFPPADASGAETRGAAPSATSMQANAIPKPTPREDLRDSPGADACGDMPGHSSATDQENQSEALWAGWRAESRRLSSARPMYVTVHAPCRMSRRPERMRLTIPAC